MIKRYGWWWVAKQMFIPEHIPVIVTLDMGVGEGDSVYKNRSEKGFFITAPTLPPPPPHTPLKKTAEKHANMETRQYLPLWNSVSLWKWKENNGIAVVAIKPSDVEFIWKCLSQLLIICVDEEQHE